MDSAIISELYRRIAGVTTKYDFAEPVTLEDCATVRAEIAALLPPNHRVRVELGPEGVEISVFEAARRYYHRTMIIVRNP